MHTFAFLLRISCICRHKALYHSRSFLFSTSKNFLGKLALFIHFFSATNSYFNVSFIFFEKIKKCKCTKKFRNATRKRMRHEMHVTTNFIRKVICRLVFFLINDEKMHSFIFIITKHTYQSECHLNRHSYICL